MKYALKKPLSEYQVVVHDTVVNVFEAYLDDPLLLALIAQFTMFPAAYEREKNPCDYPCVLRDTTVIRPLLDVKVGELTIQDLLQGMTPVEIYYYCDLHQKDLAKAEFVQRFTSGVAAFLALIGSRSAAWTLREKPKVISKQGNVVKVNFGGKQPKYSNELPKMCYETYHHLMELTANDSVSK